MNGSTATGWFQNAAVVTLNVPSGLAARCASSGGLAATRVTGTIALGPACGHVGNPVSIYPIASHICGTGYTPTSITTGPDGALWFTTSANLIGRMTTSGATTFYAAPLEGLGTEGNGGITAGPDGALWFIETTGAVGRITTSGAVTSFPLAAGDTATAITDGPDGALWFTFDNKSGNGIGRITTSGTITTYGDPSLGRTSWTGGDTHFLQDITTGPDGALWFTNWNPSETVTGGGQSFIGRISTSGAFSEYLDPLPKDDAGPLIAGPDGSIWFNSDAFHCVRASNGYYDCTATYTIGRMTTSGQFSRFSYPSAGGQQTGLAVGPDGALWFTAYAAIGRITTSGTMTPYDDPAIFAPFGITAGPDGRMWFVNGGNGTAGAIRVP